MERVFTLVPCNSKMPKIWVSNPVLSFYARNCACYTIFSVSFFSKYDSQNLISDYGQTRMQIEKKAWNQGSSCCLQERQIQKENQIEEIVKWCKENNKRGQAALKRGMFPLIKDHGTMDRRLDGKWPMAKNSIWGPCPARFLKEYHQCFLS